LPRPSPAGAGSASPPHAVNRHVSMILFLVLVLDADLALGGLTVPGG
jgi:hypothetical protein